MKDLRKKEINWVRIWRGFVAYGLGIGIGIFLVWALWLRNRDVPNFWPEGMVKDKIMRSTIEPNEVNVCYLECISTTDSLLRLSIKKGDVRFPPVKREPYPVYAIDTKTDKNEKIRWWVESRDTTYNIYKMEDLPGTAINHSCQCPEINF